MATHELIRVRPQLTRWERVKQSLRSFTLGPYNPKDKELARLFSGGRSTLAGVPVSEATAFNYSAVWCAVGLVSEQVSTVPLVLYKRVDEAKERFVGHPLYRLLHDRPNPYMGSMVFRRQLTAHRMVWGNGYAEIERDAAGRPVALWPLLPYAVQPFYTSGNELQYRVMNPNGTTITFTANDILHIRGIGSGDGTYGDSMIPFARESLGLGLAAEKFGAAFFGNGSTFGGIISYPPGIGGNIDTRKDNRDALEKMHAGVERSHRFLALYEGATYQAIGVPPNAAQFLETREFQIEEVCRWFNVPPHKLKHLKRSTNNNIEQQSIEFQTDTLNPRWVEWEEELNAKLVAPLESKQQLIEHVRQALMQADATSRAEYMSKGFSMGGFTQNDFRRLENMNPFPDAIKPDIPYVPSNMMPADLARDYWQAQIDKAKQPPPTPQPPPQDKTPAAEMKALEDQLVEARKMTQLAEDLRDVARADAEVWKTKATVHEQTIVAIEAQRDAAVTGLAEVKTDAETLRHQVADEQAKVRVAEQQREEADDKRVALAEALALTQAAKNDAVKRIEQVEAEGRAAVEAVEAQRAAVEAARVAAETERDAMMAERNELSAEVADLKRGSDMLAEEVQIERHFIETKWKPEAEAAKAEADTLRADLARARADIAAELDKAKTQRAVLLTAMRALFVDASERLLERESDRARNNQATPEKLRAWVDRFYPMHEAYVRSTFRPLLGPWVAITGESSDALLDRLVREHVDASVSELARVLDVDDRDLMAGALERTLRRWETERADVMADALVRQGMQS